MKEVLLIIQLLVAAGLIAVILLQRSEGGALGIGGGGGGGMMSSRGAANVLTRTTMVLGAVFIANCILLAIVASVGSDGQSVFDRTANDPAIGVIEEEEQGTPVPTDG
ncbi:preprotein translocase subunit SecG [Maricaulis sp.]|jgi:preprotein translocase subunit SecG|uniref:preprotein translocase subunit SecG n=1 Tax=Maricaulis sp. TaxID=1486257 RepID=UPI00261F61B2|nr:preprotein translocase subunit SecG [Maricaulis sp.]